MKRLILILILSIPSSIFANSAGSVPTGAVVNAAGVGVSYNNFYRVNSEAGVNGFYSLGFYYLLSAKINLEVGRLIESKENFLNVIGSFGALMFFFDLGFQANEQFNGVITGISGDWFTYDKTFFYRAFLQNISYPNHSEANHFRAGIQIGLDLRSKRNNSY